MKHFYFSILQKQLNPAAPDPPPPPLIERPWAAEAAGSGAVEAAAWSPEAAALVW